MRRRLLDDPARGALLLAAAAVLALLVLASLTTLWDRDETLYAESAREMLASGRFLVPTVEGRPWLEKTPLVLWLMSGAMALLGPTALAARLPSAIGLGAAALALFDAGRTLVSPRAGLLAAALLVTAPLAILEGAAATTDAVLLACLAAMLALFARAARGGVTPRLFLSFAAAAAAGQLAKGPVALAVPLLAFGGALVFRPAAFPRRRALWGLLLGGEAAGIAALLVWAIPANRATGGAVLAETFLRQVVGRALTPMQGHGGSLLWLPIYLAVLVAGFSPHTLLLPRAWRRRSALAPDARVLLLLSAAVPFALFTLAATKLPHYVLPAWPALALLVAAAVEADGGEARAGRRVAVLAGGWLLAGLVALPLLERLKPVPPIAAAIRRAADPGVPLATLGFEEPSLNFALSRTALERLRAPAEVAAWATRGEPGILVATREAFDAVRRAAGPLPLAEIAARKGIDVVHGRRIELVALRRGN